MRSELLAGVALALLGLALLNVGTGRQRDGARLYAAPLAPARVNRIAPAAAAAGLGGAGCHKRVQANYEPWDANLANLVKFCQNRIEADFRKLFVLQ